MACLEDPDPLLDYKLKCPCSAVGVIVCPFLPVNRRDEHIPSEGWTFPWRRFTRLKTLSLYFPTASPSILPCDLSSSLLLFSLIYKRTWHPDPSKMVVLMH